MTTVLLILLCLAVICIGGHFLAAYYTRKETAKCTAPGKMVTVHGEPMHVRVQGEGDGPVAVLLSGWSTAVPSVDFQPLVRQLQSLGIPTAIVEKFGYGFSGRTKVPRTVDNTVAEMREALQLAGVKSPYLLCGHSMSGVEMVRWSCLHPEEVAGIVSIDAPAPLAYTHVPLPPAALFGVQSFLCWCGLDRLLSHVPKYYKREDVYMNGFADLTAEELAATRVFQRRNAANSCCLGEMTLLKQNAQTAGGKVPDGIPVTMCIASDTKKNRWETLQPEEETFIRENNAREVVVEGLHNLQHYDPATLAREIAALARKKEDA